MTLTRSLDKRGGFISVFVWQLRRSLPAAILYWAMMAGLTLWAWFTKGRSYNGNAETMEIVITGFAFALPMIHLGDCFSRRQGDYIHALPIPRGRLYIAAFINALWQILIPIIPCRLTVYTMYRETGYMESYHIKSLTLVAIALVGLAFMMAALSGTWHGYIMASVAHLACWRIIIFGGAYFIFTTIPMVQDYSHWQEFFIFLGSPVGVVFQSFSEFSRIATYIWMPIFGTLCAVAGYHMYKRRQSEWAGHFGQCVILERVLRTEMTLAAGLAVASIMPSVAKDKVMGGMGVPLTLGSMVLAVAAAYVALELIWHRKLKNLRRNALSVIISGAALIVLTGAVSTGLGLDTAIPEVSDVLWCDAYFIYPIESGGVDDAWYVKDPAASPDGVTDFRSDIISPEMLEKVRRLHEKYIELERAAQYPYLPGRGTYQTQEWINIGYHTDSKEENSVGNYESMAIYYGGPVNSRTEPILEELRNIRREILASDEFVNGLMPLNAIDAVASLEKIMSIEEVRGDKITSAEKESKSIEGLPKDFLERLEEVMREDFTNGRFTTYDGVSKADYPIYQLNYGGEFTARGGIIWDKDREEYVTAAGKRLTLQDPGSPDYDVMPGCTLRVTKEMPATYGYLAKMYE